MKRITLQREKIYSGSLILVNREYGYHEPERGLAGAFPQRAQSCPGDGEGALLPVLEEIPQILMQRRAAVLLFHLMEKINGWRGIVPVSGWRSRQEQEEIWESSLKENGRVFTETWVAHPGHSEHQTGLAIDLGRKQERVDFIRPEFPDTGICQIFRKRAAGYGFIERYPKGRETVTGIGHEPWHFRYVGIPHARLMEREGLTLEEYTAFVRDFPYGERPCLFSAQGQEFSVSFLKMPEQDGAGPAGRGTGRSPLAALEEKAGDFVRRKEGTVEIEIDQGHPFWISGNNVDGFVITQERSRYGYQT